MIEFTAAGSSTVHKCPASGMISKPAPGIFSAILLALSTGVTASFSPTMTSVGVDNEYQRQIRCNLSAL